MWFWFALSSALLGAVDIILNKKNLTRVSPAALGWALDFFTLPVIVVLAFKDGIPSVNFIFWIAVIFSAITYVVGRNMYNHALKNNFVSDIVPITAFSGVFIYIFGLILLSESINPLPLLGLLIVLAGVYLLNVAQAKEDVLRPFKLLFATRLSILLLVALMLTSLSAVFDKMGVINTTPTSPFFVVLIEQTLTSAMLTTYLFKTEGNKWIFDVKKNLPLLFLNSLVYLAIVYVVFTAYALEGPVALVIGIKRLQILIALFLGYMLLKDKPTKITWIASLIMIAGVILIRIG